MKRPALDYYGGKWRIAPRIIALIPPHKTFVDVFCGAASITLRKPRSKNEIINDRSKEVHNFFSVLRDRNLELRLALEQTPYARDEYYACREPHADPLEQARRTVVKSWFGIGDSLDNETGFRVSLSQAGSTTAPWLTYVDYLGLFAERLRGVIVENLDYKECITRYDRPDVCFYFDPPYLMQTRSKKHAYLHDWIDEQHDEFLKLLPSLKARFVLSHYLAGPYAKLKFERHSFVARTNGNDDREEFVWIK